MSSTFLGLNTAYTGLQASNAALNTTANNIANAETEGYSRQVVTNQAADAIRSFTTYGCVGAGVETISIERVRDNFYDEKYWNNNSKLGEYETKKYYMSCIERYYTDDSSIKGFNSIFDEYSNALAELAKNPNDATVKQQAIGYTNNLTTYFNDMYTNLSKLQDDVNQEVRVYIDRINSIGEEIAALNKQINVIEMNTGAMANELRDQRDLLVDELSEICNVEVEETKIIDSTNTSRDTGGTRYCVKVCGQDLVDGNDSKGLICIPRANYESVNQTDIDGLYDVYFDMGDEWTTEDYRNKGDKLNMYSSTVGGKLGGLIAMRDGNNGENFAGKVESVDVENQKVTISVDKDYLTDLNKLNLTTTGGIVKLGNTEYYFSDWTYEYDEDSGNCTYTFQLDKDLNKNNSVGLSAQTKHVSASVGSSITYQGIPYYMSQMNEWVRAYSEAANAIEKDGILDDGTVGRNVFVGETISGDEYGFGVSYEKTGTAGNVITVTNKDDSYYMLTAGNFKIADSIVNNPGLLTTRSSQYAGSDANDIVKRLIDLATNDNPEKGGMSFRGCSADQYLVCIMSDVALNAQRANDFTTNYTELQTSIKNQRLSVSGVDNDEEAVDLTKFQQQYNLASKMISVLTEVYDRLILQTGV